MCLLEQIGERLLEGDHAVTHLRNAGAPPEEVARAQRQFLTLAQQALDGAYDLDSHTVALIRALEAACTTGTDLDQLMLERIRMSLTNARLELQLVLFMRLRRQTQDSKREAAAR